MVRSTNSGSVDVRSGTLNVHGNLKSTTDGFNSAGVSSGNLTVDGNVEVLGQHGVLTDTDNSHATIKGNLTIGGGHSGLAADKLTVSGSALVVNGDVTLGGNDGDQLTIMVSDANNVDGEFIWGGRLSLIGNADHNAGATMLIKNGGSVAGSHFVTRDPVLFLSGASVAVSDPHSELVGSFTSLENHSSLRVTKNAHAVLEQSLS